MNIKPLLWIIGGVFLLFVLVSGIATAGCFKCTINNYYNESNSMTITSGVSNNELSEGLSAAAAVAAHKFDLNIPGGQWGVSGAYESGNDENAFSGGIGWRFDGIDALFTGAATTIGDDWLFVFTVGGRF